MDISVIMTVYNGERYIRQAVESIINQDYTNYEIIIINDGSTDRTQKILMEYSSFKNIIIKKTNRIGRGKALNLALAQSSGKYISILDADDIFHPDKLKIQHEIMENDLEIGVLGTDAIIIGEEFELGESVNSDQNNIKFNIIEVTKQLGYRSPICHSSVLMRREILDEIAGYDETRKRQFDYDLWIRIAEAGWGLSVLKHSLTYKRIHNEQNFEKHDRIQHLKSSILLQKKAIETLQLPRNMYVICYVRFVYGLLPRKFRMLMRKVFSNKKRSNKLQ